MKIRRRLGENLKKIGKVFAELSSKKTEFST